MLSKYNLFKCTIAFYIVALTILIVITTAHAQGSIAPDPMRPERTITNSDVDEWSRKAMLSIFNYDYTNYQKTFADSSIYFTKSGWDSYMAILKASHDIDAVKANKMTVSAIIPNTMMPVVIRSMVNNQYVWTVKMPLIISYQSAANVVRQSATANLVVVPANSVDGIAISNIVINIEK